MSSSFKTEFEEELASPDYEKHRKGLESRAETRGGGEEDRGAPEGAEGRASQRRNHQVCSRDRSSQVSSSPLSCQSMLPIKSYADNIDRWCNIGLKYTYCTADISN